MWSQTWPELWSSVTLPLWSVVALGCFAAVTTIDRVVSPIVRSTLAYRRRVAIDALNAALAVKIQPFKTARRQDVIAQILLDPDVRDAIAGEAKERGEPEAAVLKRARGYAREIVPTFSAAFYFRLGARMARGLSRFLYRVRLGASDASVLERIDSRASVVFVINHRSNLDYVLVTYLAAGASALSYAVGEWARVPGLERVIRLMGGYFIRRDSGNALYRRVLASYVRQATAAGVTQAVFPEGGLSRTGALQPPRLGLLAYMVSDFDPGGARDVLFVPVGINYERVLEDRVLTAAAATPKGQRPRFSFRLGTFLGFAARNVLGRLTGRWYRYGYACVSFGRPVSLREHLANRGADLRVLAEAERFREIEILGRRLMQAVGAAVPVLPVSLVAAAVLEADGRSLSRLELKGAVFDLMRRLSRQGVEVYLPRADQDYAVDVGVRMLLLRKLIVERDGLVGEQPGERDLLSYYANAIVHHLDRSPWPVPSGQAVAEAGAAPQASRAAAG